MILDAPRLKDLLSLDHETGKLVWLERPLSMFEGGQCPRRAHGAWNGKCAGREAFTAISRGYKVGRIHDRRYFAHRVVWALHYGAWPEGEINHINGNKSDNAIANLRDVAHVVNGRNCPRIRTNSSGQTGVSWDKRGKFWDAYIGDSPRVSLGRFAVFEEAVAARLEAEVKWGYHPNHGRAA